MGHSMYLFWVQFFTSDIQFVLISFWFLVRYWVMYMFLFNKNKDKKLCLFETILRCFHSIVSKPKIYNFK